MARSYKQLYEEIADLQRQLREAQEDFRCEQDAHRAHLNSLARTEEERDAAIERGKLLWWEAKREIQVQVALVVALLEVAEAAETDAAEQRALAERLKAEAVEELHVKDHWEEHCKLCDMMWPVGGAPRHEEACPAEAQEQSGQEDD